MNFDRKSQYLRIDNKCGCIVILVGIKIDSIYGTNLFSTFNLGCCDWWNEQDRRIATLEFDRDRKSMGVIANSGLGKNSLLVKVLYLSGYDSFIS